jgi:uncharacterized protein YjiS (DUF1127 family)
MKSPLEPSPAATTGRLIAARPAPRPRHRWPLFATLSQWLRHSRDRELLRRLDARQLRDIGLTREQVEREVEKPFWRG